MCSSLLWSWHLVCHRESMYTIELTSKDFKDKIFDFETETEWKYKGSLPAIVDFYADWCGPCRVVSPILEDLAKQYFGKLNIYKIDTDKEEELSALFGIQSIPTLLFIPIEGSLMIQKGALPKNLLDQIIRERLLQPSESSKVLSP